MNAESYIFAAAGFVTFLMSSSIRSFSALAFDIRLDHDRQWSADTRCGFIGVRLLSAISLVARRPNRLLSTLSCRSRNPGILKDPGGQPRDRILERDRGQPLDLTRFLSTAIGLARTLGQVHQQGLIHKDIKPANVVVDDAGNAWLTGFGIATQLARERQSPEPPEFSAGTLAYMAPEHTGRMNRSIDSQSDLYSLGMR